jgi:hypothetical protein
LSSRTMCLKFQLTMASTSASVAKAMCNMSLRNLGPIAPLGDRDRSDKAQ